MSPGAVESQPSVDAPKSGPNVSIRRLGMALFVLLLVEGGLGVSSAGSASSGASAVLIGHVILGLGAVALALGSHRAATRFPRRAARYATVLTTVAIAATALTGAIFLAAGFRHGGVVDRALALMALAGSLLMIAWGSVRVPPDRLNEGASRRNARQGRGDLSEKGSDVAPPRRPPGCGGPMRPPLQVGRRKQNVLGPGCSRKSPGPSPDALRAGGREPCGITWPGLASKLDSSSMSFTIWRAMRFRLGEPRCGASTSFRTWRLLTLAGSGFARPDSTFAPGRKAAQWVK